MFDTPTAVTNMSTHLTVCDATYSRRSTFMRTFGKSVTAATLHSMTLHKLVIFKSDSKFLILKHIEQNKPLFDTKKWFLEDNSNNNVTI
jgi:hypothetical protein